MFITECFCFFNRFPPCGRRCNHGFSCPIPSQKVLALTVLPACLWMCEHPVCSIRKESGALGPEEGCWGGLCFIAVDLLKKNDVIAKDKLEPSTQNKNSTVNLLSGHCEWLKWHLIRVRDLTQRILNVFLMGVNGHWMGNAVAGLGGWSQCLVHCMWAISDVQLEYRGT